MKFTLVLSLLLIALANAGDIATTENTENPTTIDTTTTDIPTSTDTTTTDIPTTIDTTTTDIPTSTETPTTTDIPISSESIESSESAESSEEDTELPLAKPCDPEACQLPNCRCSSTAIPGGLTPRDVPQFVMVTFDDAVNVNNIVTYRDLLYNRTNPNACRSGATFYVTHEYTNYFGVNELYNQGFEIALHSISHQTNQGYWQNADYEVNRQEFADQVTQMSLFANIPAASIKGVRLPFLQMSGNASFDMMSKHGLLYDCSWPTTAYVNPALWPYTLDYASSQDCIVPPCPTASFPGVWVVPMVSWIDLVGFPCSMADACYLPPDRENEEAWYEFIVTNFERHYLNNRAPFPFFIHEANVNAFPAVKNAMLRFLNLINNLPDVYMVNTEEVIEWVKNPVPIPEYNLQSCRTFTPTACTPRLCGPLTGAHNNLDYWMTVCSLCPNSYPWLGNPLGA